MQNVLFINNISNLIESQHSNFYSFLLINLENEFLTLSNPIICTYPLVYHQLLLSVLLFVN